jgi:hypothetical protein
VLSQVVIKIVTLLIGLVTMSSFAQENPPELAQIRSLFGKQRLPTEDVIFFTNNDVLRGEVTNPSFHLTTPYAEVLVPLRKCAGLSLEKTDQAGELIITVNANQLSGFLTDRQINIRIGGSGTDIPIRKEKIRYILFRRSPQELRDLLPYGDRNRSTNLIVMANGDLLTGGFTDPHLNLRTDLTDHTIPVTEIQEFVLNKGRITLKRKKGEPLAGALQTEDLSFQLDCGIRLDAIFKDRLARYSSGDGMAKVMESLPAEGTGRSSDPLMELPSEEQIEAIEIEKVPEAPPPTPTPELPTSTPTLISTLTPTLTPTPTPTGPVSNIYESEKHGFRIERPDQAWRMVTSPAELKELKEDAVVAFESPEGVYSMVLVEKLPQVPLDEYVNAVSPELEAVELISDEKGSLNRLPARKRVWRGRHQNIPFRFYYTLVAMGEYRIQIVSWCAENTLTEALVKQINLLEDSFEPYPPLVPNDRPTRQPTRTGIPPR